jgi:hypothetical protein
MDNSQRERLNSSRSQACVITIDKSAERGFQRVRLGAKSKIDRYVRTSTTPVEFTHFACLACSKRSGTSPRYRHVGQWVADQAIRHPSSCLKARIKGRIHQVRVSMLFLALDWASVVCSCGRGGLERCGQGGVFPEGKRSSDDERSGEAGFPIC